MQFMWRFLGAMLVVAGCDPPPPEPPPIIIAEGEGEGEGEGDVGITPPVFERDGSVLEGDLVLTHADAAPLTIALGIRNVHTSEVSLLSDPPVLVGGADVSMFAIPAQPATTIAPGASSTFEVIYTPRALGVHEGLLLFAYGLSQEERALLRIEVEATNP